VSGDSNALGVGHAPAPLINGGLASATSLFQISVVGFLRIADDGNEALSMIA